MEEGGYRERGKIEKSVPEKRDKIGLTNLSLAGTSWAYPEY